MSAEYTDSNLAQILETISRLQSPIPDLPTLLQLLAPPLAHLGLLPPRFRQYNVTPLSSSGLNISRYISPLQRALVEYVIPSWEPMLLQEDKYQLLEQYFVPDAMSFAVPSAGQIALYAYSTILSTPMKEYTVRLLVKLCMAYPIDVLHAVWFTGTGRTGKDGKQTLTWEDHVRDVISVPAKVANYMKERSDMPTALEHGGYFSHVSIRTEILICAVSAKNSQEKTHSVAYLFSKLVSVGVFPPSIPNSPAQPSFFQSTLKAIRSRLASPDAPQYASFWTDLLSDLPSSMTLRSIMTSLISSLAHPDDVLDASQRTVALVKREGRILRELLGPLCKANMELVDCFSAVALGRSWDEGHARIFVCWAAGAKKGTRTREGLELFLSKIVEMWTDAEHVKHSLLSQHRYLTSLLLLTVNSFPAPSPAHELVLSPPFVQSIASYLSHLDPSVRRCGMLVAEEIARRAGKTLDFGEWDGDEQGKTWCRRTRALLATCDVDSDDIDDEEVDNEPSSVTATPPTAPLSHGPRSTITVETPSGYDSDDSLTGYASPVSSRSASPTPSELAEIERDPTVRVGVKKVPRPVYLAQLGEMVRSTSGHQGGNEQDTATKTEVALDVAEELIRRKSGYGTELEENATNLVYGFIGLQDNYDLEGFDPKRQAALNALVACCPRKSAPTIIEQFFTLQYSTDQRFVMLNALALGARELASLPVPDLPGRSQPAANKVAFPSKQLPPALHRKYLTQDDQMSTNNPVQALLEGISRLAIEKGKEATEEKMPEVVRQRHLRVRPSSKITELPSTSSASARTALMRQLAGTGSRLPQLATFTDVAAEFFICPLINRFWVFLRDEQTREARTAHQPVLHQYRSAASGLVLSALILGRMLETLAVLVDAARNAREWLHVIAPDALELALTLGTRPVSKGEGADENAEENFQASNLRGTQQSKEAALLTAALELALIVLDGALDLDDGRSLGLEHTALLLGTGEWAGKVFGSLEDGAKVPGGGGVQEVRLRRAAAGVILKVDDLTSKWRRSMLDLV